MSYDVIYVFAISANDKSFEGCSLHADLIYRNIAIK